MAKADLLGALDLRRQRQLRQPLLHLLRLERFPARPASAVVGVSRQHSTEPKLNRCLACV